MKEKTINKEKIIDREGKNDYYTSHNPIYNSTLLMVGKAKLF